MLHYSKYLHLQSALAGILGRLKARSHPNKTLSEKPSSRWVSEPPGHGALWGRAGSSRVLLGNWLFWKSQGENMYNLQVIKSLDHDSDWIEGRLRFQKHPASKVRVMRSQKRRKHWIDKTPIWLQFSKARTMCPHFPESSFAVPLLWSVI